MGPEPLGSKWNQLQPLSALLSPIRPDCVKSKYEYCYSNKDWVKSS